MPLIAATFVLPCSVPLPALRVAVTTVLLSALRKFPYESSIRSVGCCAKAIPAVAVLEGCARMVNLLAAAGLTTTLTKLHLSNYHC